MPKKNLVYIQSLRNGAADRAGQPVAYQGSTRYMKAPLEFLVERLNDSPLGERYTLQGVIVAEAEPPLQLGTAPWDDHEVDEPQSLPGTPERSDQGTPPEPLVALHPLPPVSADEFLDEAALCIVCYDAPSGTVLEPCGHDHFCITCARQFRTCPLCRVPLIPIDDDGRVVPGAVARPSLLSDGAISRNTWVIFSHFPLVLGAQLDGKWHR
jgi:hypothetical protein